LAVTSVTEGAGRKLEQVRDLGTEHGAKC
jgi:hypothetical protein